MLTTQDAAFAADMDRESKKLNTRLQILASLEGDESNVENNTVSSSTSSRQGIDGIIRSHQAVLQESGGVVHISKNGSIQLFPGAFIPLPIGSGSLTAGVAGAAPLGGASSSTTAVLSHVQSMSKKFMMSKLRVRQAAWDRWLLCRNNHAGDEQLGNVSRMAAAATEMNRMLHMDSHSTSDAVQPETSAQRAFISIQFHSEPVRKKRRTHSAFDDFDS